MRCLLISILTLIPVLALSDGMPEAADAAAGKAVYSQTCVACHGVNGKGTIPGVTDFTAKDSPLRKSDVELVNNISEGFQSPGSFMAMPAKGGNPTLT
ncbi:MAG: c-type cytochrome, partial [Proteobacteria bacterium]|nr:c-type cytochrome [Pseudomonadota bacterium]